MPAYKDITEIVRSDSRVITIIRKFRTVVSNYPFLISVWVVFDRRIIISCAGAANAGYINITLIV